MNGSVCGGLFGWRLRNSRADRDRRIAAFSSCWGGVSHIDPFDYKPDLIRHDRTGKGEVASYFRQTGT
jgi:hypothetical protein